MVSTSKQGNEKNKYITFEEFSRVRLKIGKVIQAKDVPGMKKVFKVTVDIGDEQRDLAVGAALHYKSEELVGKVVVVCTNLEPKKIGSIISNGMLLAPLEMKEGQYSLRLPKMSMLDLSFSRLLSNARSKS